jgi:hypothetical protein
MRAPSTRVPHDASAMRVPRTETSKGAAVHVGFGSGVSPDALPSVEVATRRR